MNYCVFSDKCPGGGHTAQVLGIPGMKFHHKMMHFGDQKPVFILVGLASIHRNSGRGVFNTEGAFIEVKNM